MKRVLTSTLLVAFVVAAFGGLSPTEAEAAPIRSCEYKPNVNVTVCRFSIIATRFAGPDEQAVVRGQIKALDNTSAFDSVTKLTAIVGSIAVGGTSLSAVDNSFVVYSQAAGWSTYASVTHPPGIDSGFRYALVYFRGNEVGNVRIRTTTVIVDAG